MSGRNPDGGVGATRPSHAVDGGDTWALRQFGPPDARDGVLMLPGLMCTSAFYDDVIADPRVDSGDIRWFAATPPGFGGRPLPADFVPTVEGYARLTSDLADGLDCGTVVAHSYFANVAVAMAARGRFTGRLLLLSPCFTPADEEKDLRAFNRIGRLPGVGRLLWALIPRLLASGMKGRFPPSRQAELVAEMQRFDPTVTRQVVRHYFDHLHGQPSPVSRLCGAGVASWVVRGEGDETGLSEETRRRLDACPGIELVTVAGARHFLMTDQPSALVEVIIRFVHGAHRGTG